jgi:hypothetical protein
MPPPSDEPDDKSKRRAEELVPPVSAGADHNELETRALIVTALSEDLQARGDHEALSETRLTKLEAQTHGLAEAVTAIANPKTAALVQAVKDEM